MSVLARWSVLSLVLLSCSTKGSDSFGGEGDADTDTDTDTDADSCGDGDVTGVEQCDGAGESKDCDADCTYVECGDDTINKTAGEICEPSSTEPWDRCAFCTFYGAGLDGTFGAKWEELTYPDLKWEVAGLQSFHYTGEAYLYDLSNDLRYEISTDSWSDIANPPPFGTLTYWVNGAVDSTSIYVPRESAMHQFDMATETWSTLEGKVPDGSWNEVAAVFDGAGQIWYEGPTSLVEYDPVTGAYTEHKHSKKIEMSETRMAYDPWGNKILVASFVSDRFLIYDIDADTFTEGSASPGGEILDSTCGDNSGGVYTGSSDYLHMYRYDVAADTWTLLPDPPAKNDDNSTCVVSQDGWLYYPTSTIGFFRLQLGLLAP